MTNEERIEMLLQDYGDQMRTISPEFEEFLATATVNFTVAQLSSAIAKAENLFSHETSIEKRIRAAVIDQLNHSAESNIFFNQLVNDNFDINKAVEKNKRIKQQFKNLDDEVERYLIRGVDPEQKPTSNIILTLDDNEHEYELLQELCNKPNHTLGSKRFVVPKLDDKKAVIFYSMSAYTKHMDFTTVYYVGLENVRKKKLDELLADIMEEAKHQNRSMVIIRVDDIVQYLPVQISKADEVTSSEAVTVVISKGHEDSQSTNISANTSQVQSDGYCINDQISHQTHASTSTTDTVTSTKTDTMAAGFTHMEGDTLTNSHTDSNNESLTNSDNASRSVTDADNTNNNVNHADSDSYARTLSDSSGQNWNQNHTDSWNKNISHSDTKGTTESDTHTDSDSNSVSRAGSQGVTETQSHTDSENTNATETNTKGTSNSQSISDTETKSTTNTKGTQETWGTNTRHSTSTTQSQGSSESKSNSTGTSTSNTNTNS
jgi:hypothetical protein